MIFLFSSCGRSSNENEALSTPDIPEEMNNAETTQPQESGSAALGTVSEANVSCAAFSPTDGSEIAEQFPSIEQYQPLQDEIEEISSGIWVNYVYANMDGWKEDIIQFRNHVFAWHPKFVDSEVNTLARNIEIGIAFDEHINHLLESVPYITEFEIKAELQRSLALFQDNHLIFGAGAQQRAETFLYNLRRNRYPVEFGWFSDGFYLYRTAEDENLTNVLNHRLIAINDIPIQDILFEFGHFMSVENIYDARHQFARDLNIPGILQALNVCDGQQTTYTFVNQYNEAISVTMPDPLPAVLNISTYWLPHVFPIPLIYSRNAGDLPFFLQNAYSAHWHTFIEEYGVLYIRINGYFAWYNQEIIADLIEQINEKGSSIRAAVVDARNNPGGATLFYHDLFNALANAVPQDKLFYFMNEGSISAALLGGGYLYELGATIVGQPSGQQTDFYGFYGSLPFPMWNLIMQNSNFHLAVPNNFHTIRNNGVVAPDLTFRPHVLIEYTIENWVNNYDPYLEYVLGLLR